MLGGEVGYAVRFENRGSSSTRIKYLTGELTWLPVELDHMECTFTSSKHTTTMDPYG